MFPHRGVDTFPRGCAVIPMIADRSSLLLAGAESPSPSTGEYRVGVRATDPVAAGRRSVAIASGWIRRNIRFEPTVAA